MKARFADGGLLDLRIFQMWEADQVSDTAICELWVLLEA
jgi:hypothetical protein